MEGRERQKREAGHPSLVTKSLLRDNYIGGEPQAAARGNGCLSHLAGARGFYRARRGSCRYECVNAGRYEKQLRTLDEEPAGSTRQRGALVSLRMS